MTKKQLKAKLDMFIKSHKPDDFKDDTTASGIFFDSLPFRTQRSTTKIRSLNSYDVISSWWWNAYTPMSEDEVLTRLDPNMVTHKFVEYHMRKLDAVYVGILYPDNVVEKLADWSFKYNVVKVWQKPGHLCVFLKESDDYQSNITGEVVEQIAKCLEF